MFNREKEPLTVKKTKEIIKEHLEKTLVQDIKSTSYRDLFFSVAYATRELLTKQWLETQKRYYEESSKRIYYLSMEFLIGKSLKNHLLNLGILDIVRDAVKELGFSFSTLVNIEEDAGLGNGGLGRLAACYLDSMATLGIPGYGYGIRYDYGIFSQKIENGYQVEEPDNWLRYGDPWQICRGEFLYPVNFYGKTIQVTDDLGKKKIKWVETQEVMAMAYDVPVTGYKNNVVNSLRLWQAQSPKGFEFSYFNHGNYLRAIEDIALSENISRVLYPNDSICEGKELRLRQEYFLVSATIQDVLRRYTKNHIDLDLLAEKVSIQLNDTHPALAITEMMRILVDREEIDWDTAWNTTLKIFNYTNHTLLPEALERWSINLLKKLLPRHLEIIYEINFRWLNHVKELYPNDSNKIKNTSIIEEGEDKMVNMAKLAIVGSAKVNGVSELHSSLIKNFMFKDFNEISPDKFINKTNGITPRRWLKICNPKLSALIDHAIGSTWTKSLEKISLLKEYAEDKDFVSQWLEEKKNNKKSLAKIIFQNVGIKVDVDSMFDCQIKRFHEYKRQLMNIMRVIHDYVGIKNNTKKDLVPRTIIFSGKAAPGYFIAKLIIKLINSVANIVNNDKQVSEVLKVIFLPNYNVSLAEHIIPAADLSEQISMAGTEASGTGNMKFALNGALTIGTLDGANIEMLERIGKEHMFIFGLTEKEITDFKKNYNPQEYYSQSNEVKIVIDMIQSGVFNKNEDVNLFKPIIDSLLQQDSYCVFPDFPLYLSCQEKVDKLYQNTFEWGKSSLYNTAGMGYFSSDRAVKEYAQEVWKVL